MESKNIKVVDEHSIDRNANVICAIDVDGSDYVIYSIERDSENDNVFVSKLLKNIDGTSSMINIEDSMEKSKIAEIVKELIKYAIDNEATTMTGNVVSLPTGKNVMISSVLINKEQYINVQKTYISTVKKSVTKVSEDYYNVKGSTESLVDTAPVTPEVSVAEPVVEPVIPVIPVEPTPVVAPSVPEVAPSVVEPTIQPVNVTIPNVVASDVVSTTPVTNDPVVAQEPVIPTPVLPVSEPVIAPEVVQPVIPAAPTPVVPAVETPIVETPVVEAPVVEPVSEPVVSQPSQLIFDASKESNLNVALGEASNEANISATDVASIREFGEDTPSTQPILPEQPVANIESAPVASNGKSRGFANNKFFMFIAIAFFTASCVFLGYEVFNYFQLVK